MYKPKHAFCASVVMALLVTVSAIAQPIPTNFYKPKVDFSTGTTPFSIAVGDIDGDGKAEMVVVNAGSNTVSVFRNTSSYGTIDATSFAAKIDFPTENYPVSVVIRDMDGDGKPDLVIANRYSNNISILRNVSIPGTVNASSFEPAVYFSSGSGPLALAIADIDADGKPDIAVANYSSNTISVLKNNCISGSITATSFANKEDFATGAEPSIVAVGDLDGDGKPDLAVSNFAASSVSVLRNTSSTGIINTSSFSTKVDFVTGDNPYSVSIADLDADGKQELVVVNVSSASISVLHNTSTTGTISATSFNAKVDFGTGNHPVSAAIGDLDADGKRDIVITNQLSDNISVLRNTTIPGSINAGSFDPKVDFATGNEPVSVAVGDLDGNGNSEVAVTNYTSNTVSVFQIDSPCRNLAVSCSSNNSVLYYGYSGDQTVTVTGVPTGGTAPYTISISMDRPLKCDVITSSGDEVWTGSASTTSNSNTSCPTAAVAPTSTAINIAQGGSYSVNAILMADAVFTITVTDALGCKAICTTKVHAEDVRCFAGNSSIQKITLCHRTGDPKKPCVKICVDQSSVEEHLQHGDFLGNCTENCVAPPASFAARSQSQMISETTTADFGLKVLPNPSKDRFALKLESKNPKNAMTLRIVDAVGTVMDTRTNLFGGKTLQVGANYRPGIYYAELNQGNNKKLVRLIKL
jgi:hypothetical protein